MRPGIFLQSGIRGFSDRDEALKNLRKVLPSSVVFFRADFTDRSDLLSLIKEINHIYKVEEGVEPPVFAVDQEGGNVVRLPWLDYNPSNSFLGMVDNKKLTNLVGKLTGKQLSDLGIHWNLAPVLDTQNGYNQVILERSFSGEVQKVAEHGVAYIKGLQAGGVAATAKHFPGHGGVLGDSHLMLPKDSRPRSVLLNDAYPFREAIRAGVSSIMLSHVLYEDMDPEHPASMSQTVQDMLRNTFDYHGVIVSDSVDMKAVSKGYSPKELVLNSVGNETDMVECADLATSIEMADHMGLVDSTKLKGKQERIRKVVPETRLKFTPPADVIDSYSTLFSRVERCNDISPEDPFELVFLDVHPESKVSEAGNPFTATVDQIRRMNLDFNVSSLEDLEKQPTNGGQLIFVGRNEHLKDRFTRINRLCQNNKCVFISTSVSQDTGVLDPGVGYISAYSSKKQNLLGAIYKALGFY